MKSMKCCQDCEDGVGNQVDYRELMELEIRKEALAEQLRCLNASRGEPLHVLEKDIIGLQGLIANLKLENQNAYGAGKAEVDRLVDERLKFEEETKSEMTVLI